MPGIDRYLGVRAAFSPVYSEATNQWYFLMNLTDTAQVYRIDRPGAWPEMLTDYPERVSGLHAAPKRPGLAFSRDHGGNEHHQLYWMDLTTLDVTPLTRDPQAVHLFGCFSPDGRYIAYSSTARNGTDYDLYVMPVDAPDQAELVLTRPGHWEVRDWTDNGEWLVEEMRGNMEQALYRFDRTRNAVTPVTHQDAEAIFRSPAVAADGRVFVLTDYGRDFVGLAVINPPGNLEFVETLDADVDGLAMDGEGRTLAYTVNREGFSELHLCDIASGQDRHVSAFDHAIVFGLTFDAAGQVLAVTHAGPDHTMNVSLVGVNEGSVVQLTYAPMTGLDPKSLVTPTVFRYRSFDGREIPAYLYQPSAGEPAPVVISVHGGPEAQERPWFSGLYQYLVAHGYAVIAPNVRGSTGYGKAYAHLDDREKRMDSVKDVASLVEWIRRQPGLNGERIAIYGGSYGGYMVLSSITQYPDLFQAAIDIVGIANLESFLENTSPWRRALREVEYGYLATDREFLRRFSPIHQVDRIQAPLFVIHGANDPRVPLNEAEQIVEALHARNHPVEFRVFPDEGHGIAKMKNRVVLYPEMVAFLDRHLKG